MINHPSDPPPTPGPAGFPVDMIRAHLRDIPSFGLPAGFAFRPMQPEDGPTWDDLWRDAEPYFQITSGKFTQEFGGDLPAIPRRCFLLVDAGGKAIGTISAWYDTHHPGQDYGRVHWLAIRRSYQGRGLAKAMMTHALNVLAQWHQRAVLTTQTRRCGALKLYLDFGFAPDLSAPGAIDAWRTVKAALPHPALRAI